MHEISISKDSYKYIQSLAVPLEDTPASVIERIIADHRLLATPSTPKTSSTPNMKFTLSTLPNVSFTILKSASIAATPVKNLYWNDVLEELIAYCARSHEASVIVGNLSLQTQLGKSTDKGYRYIESAGFSFQGVDAVRACKNIAGLSSKFNIPIELELHWQNSPKAQFAGETGRISLP
jgi:hypothetical protein